MKNAIYLALGLFLLASCAKDDTKLDNDIADVTIYMKAVKTDNEIGLDLWDTQGNTGSPLITTTAEPNHTIVWKLAEDSDIQQITAIYKKEDSKQIFEVLPYRVSPGVWQAKVAEWAVGNMQYNIDFIYKDGTKVTIDPIVDVPPAT